MLAIDRRGQRFGRLLLVKRKRKTSMTFYWCQCDCGNKKWVSNSNLINGITRSCGCLSLESKKARKRPDSEIRLSEIIRYYRRNDKVAGRVFDLTREEVHSLVSQFCRYCGVPGTPYVGLDRSDNKIGHTTANSVPCCATCNRAKLQMSVEEFYAWVERVYNHRKGHQHDRLFLGRLAS